MKHRIHPFLTLAQAVSRDHSPVGQILINAMRQTLIQVLQGRKDLSPKVKDEMQKALLELTPRESH